MLPTPCAPGGLLAIGEAAGEDEDLRGEGFVGSAGKRLDGLLRELGCRRGYEYGVANIARCRPPGNRKPMADEIAACIPKLADAIARIRPAVLLLVGGTAANAFLGPGPLLEKIQQTTVNGRCDFQRSHPAFKNALQTKHPNLWPQGIIAIPMPHTSGLAWNRSADNGERWSVIGTRQVKNAVSLLGIKPVVTDAPQSSFDF